MMLFDLIGSNDTYYFFVAFEKNNVLNDGAYFVKVPIDFFDFVDRDQNVIKYLLQVEVYLQDNYKDLINSGILTKISNFQNIMEGD